jgi:hypothetical protein
VNTEVTCGHFLSLRLLILIFHILEKVDGGCCNGLRKRWGKVVLTLAMLLVNLFGAGDKLKWD